jgi:hypothetical protein
VVGQSRAPPMSVTTRTWPSGKVSWQDKWWESGRGSRQRSQTFATKRDAQTYKADIRRVQRLVAHAPGAVVFERLEDWLTTWFTSNSWSRTLAASRTPRSPGRSRARWSQA